MSMDELAEILQTIDWFSHLGTANVAAEEWEQFARHAVQVEFNLPVTTAPASPRLLTLGWFPTSNSEEDPVHGTRLAALAEQQDKTPEFKRARLKITKLTLKSLRTMTEHLLFKVGASDYTEAARGAALSAFRQAASEIVVGQQGLWRSLALIYQRGNWPLGMTPDGSIVVL